MCKNKFCRRIEYLTFFLILVVEFGMFGINDHLEKQYKHSNLSRIQIFTHIGWTKISQVYLFFQEFFQRHDTNHDGQITFKEFVEFISEHEKRLHEIFTKVDVNRDGKYEFLWMWPKKNVLILLYYHQKILRLYIAVMSLSEDIKSFRKEGGVKQFSFFGGKGQYLFFKI